MAKTRYTFEKRQKEKARQLKQIEKASKRMKAKQPKVDEGGDAPGESSGPVDLVYDAQSLPGTSDKPGSGKEDLQE